jgi:MraZ protein
VNLVFQGASALALDAKGRMAIPARHRDALQALCDGQLTVTKHPDGCLLVFPRPAWETFRDKVAALPMSASGWKRIFLGNAKDVMLLGMGSHFELWDAQRYAAHEAEVMAQAMPDALQDFTF